MYTGRFLNACVLLDIPVQWIYPRKSDGILSGTYDLADFEAALQAQTRPACVYVTSPDYLGRMADIAGLAELCHRYHAKLLVDNAHGAHLAFCRGSVTPFSWVRIIAVTRRIRCCRV